MTTVNEKLFETAITEYLVASGGYLVCKWGTRPEFAEDFDAALGLDMKELFAFIDATQEAAWASLVKAHGGNLDTARKRFLHRLSTQIDERGTVDVLRHG